MRWFGLASICLVVVGSCIPAYSIFLRKRAESLIRNASILYQYPGNAPAINTVQALYKGELRQMQGCTPVSCGYEVVVSNKILAALHWEPNSELRSEIWVKNGTVQTTILDYASSANPRHSIVSHVYIQDGEGPLFTLDPWEESSPIDTNGIVTVSPESLRTNEQTILGFDTKCLTSHRGCATIADLLPTVWEQTKDGNVRCRLQNREGLIDGPKWLHDALK